MSSESERRLSTEELKRLNQPQAMQAPPTPPDTPTRQDWNDLLVALTALYRLERSNSNRLDHLEASVGAQEALLRALTQLVGQLPTQAQLEALARDVARIRAELQQTGKKKERRFSLPKLCLPYIPWSRLFLGLAALSMTGAALWVVWSSWEKIWNIFSPIFQ